RVDERLLVLACQHDHGRHQPNTAQHHRRAAIGASTMSARVGFVDPLDLVDAERYGRRGYPHDVWTRLRTEAPVARLEAPGWEPVWAITQPAAAQQIAKDTARI